MVNLQNIYSNPPLIRQAITTKVVSLNQVHVEVNSVQHYVIKFVSDLQQIGGVLWVLQCPPQVASLEWDNLAESYYLSTTEICPNKSLWWEQSY